MAVDKNKIIAEATKLVQKGAFDKAIKAYEKIVAEDPKDVRIVLKIGELYQKLRDDKAAADSFKRVADIYTDQGFFLKAVAVYKQASKLDPDDLRVNEKLAQLNQQLGLMSDAMSQLQLVAAAYERAGDQQRLLEVLKRMVELDPDNIASSIKLGELHGRANQPEEALEYFQRAADHLKAHSRPDEWVKVAERIAALRPSDSQLARELAHVYLAKGDTKRALAKLQFCFKADPKDVQTLTLLAQAFRDLGQTGKTVSVYKELAHVYDEQRKPNEARSIWRKVQELAPDDPDANAAIGGGPVAAAASPPPPGPPPGALRSAPPAGPPPGALRAAAPPAGPPPGALRPPAPAPAAAGPADVHKLLSEVEVYVKYGLHPKALEHLKKIFALDPQNAEAFERAREVHLAAGDPDSAAAMGAQLVRVLHGRGEIERAKEELLRLRQIAPGHPEVHELAELVGGERTDEVSLSDTADVEELTLATDAAVEIAGEDDLALAVAGAGHDEVVEDEDDEVVDEETVEEEEAVGAGAGIGSLRPRSSDELELDLAAEAAAAAHDEEEVVEDELPPPPARPAPARPAPSARPALTPPPGPPPGALRPAVPAAKPAAPPPGPPPGAAKRPPSPAPAKPAPAKPAPAKPAPAAAKPAPPPAKAAPRPPVRPPPPPPEEEELDLSDDLEEADFFLQQGLLDDAKEKLAGLAQFYPDHSGVKAKLSEIERREKGSAHLGEVRATPTLIAPASSDDSFDIARDLADELGGAGDVDAGAGAGSAEDFQFSVEDVFNQFKKGVEQTVGKEDSDTHFDLGIAYREMGLLDAAVEEFETAAKGNNRKKEVDCYSMVGLCRVAQGDTKGAIQAFRRALASDFLNRDAAKSLHFEIGAAYEAAGNADGALFFFQKLAKIDPAYRDVTGKVAALGGGPGKVPAEFAAAAARPAAKPPGAATAGGGAARPAAKPVAPAKPAPARPGAAKPAGPAVTPVPGSKKNIGYL
jgi:tetratricopeptide (TPR) repeat protein